MFSPRTSLATQNLMWQRAIASLLQVSTILKLVLVFLLAGLLVFGDLQGWPITRRFRINLMDGTAPFWSLTHNTTHWIQEKNSEIKQYFLVYQENQQLRQRLEQLTQWRNAANQLAAENSHLKKFLKVPPISSQTTITARVITTPYTPFNQTLMINAGSKQGVEKYQPVIVPEGVVGRIIEVGNNSARVLLLTDQRSRIPVKGESSKVQAIVTGDQSHILKILHYRTKKDFLPNQRLVTSGEGGVFPEGLIVGTLSAYNPHSNTLHVRPAVTWKKLDFVQIINRSFSGSGADPS